MFLFPPHHRIDSHGVIQPIPQPVPAPEIDPGSAIVPLLMLAGALAVMFGAKRGIEASTATAPTPFDRFINAALLGAVVFALIASVMVRSHAS